MAFRSKQGIGQFPVSEKQGNGQVPVLSERVGFLAFLSLRNQEMCTHMDISVLFFNLIQCAFLGQELLNFNFSK